jgi:imidazolonepropionase-like amidohydrolase
MSGLIKHVTFLVIFICAISCSSTNQSAQVQVLTGATLFDGTGSDPIENSVVVVKDGKIDCVGTEDDCTTPSGAEVIDVTGKFITPGLVDAHVHFFQTAFFDSRPDALDLRETYPFMEVAAYQKQHPQRYYDAYLCSGVTGVYDVGGFTWTVDFQESAERKPDAPHVAAAGPLITPSTLDLFNTPSDKVLVNLDEEETGRKTVQYLSALGSTGIKMWQLNIDSEGYMNRVEAVADEIEKQENQMIAHATTLVQAKAAMRSGTKLLVHSVSDTEVDQEFIDLAKQEGTIYTPTLVVGGGYMLAYRAAAGVAPFRIEDPNGCVDSKTLQMLEEADQFKDHPAFSGNFKKRLGSFNPETDIIDEVNAANLRKVHEAGIPIAVGTDAGNPGTLHGISIYDEMEAMQQAGIPTRDLIVMATHTGAKAMRRADDFGTLEHGKIADLIVLEEDPSEDIANMRSIEQVIRMGIIKDVEKIGGN